MKVTAIIVAGGQGLRMETAVRKQYLELDGIPVLQHTLRVFSMCPVISDICLVIPHSDHDYCREFIVSPLGSLKPVHLVSGGDERQQSVYNGLKSLNLSEDDIVVIHDGVRPFVSCSSITECSETAKHWGAAILAVPVSDTLKISGQGSLIEKTLDRNKVWAAQTPQAFKFGLIQRAHQSAISNHFTGTDDASLVEALGAPVKLVTGNRYNLKLTTQDDLLLASGLLKESKKQ